MSERTEARIFSEEEMDTLLEMAFRYREDREFTALLENNPPLSDTEKAACDRAYANALRTRKSTASSAHPKQVLQRALLIAACLVLIAAIGGTVAVATSATVRSQVYRLIIACDPAQNRMNVRFDTDEKRSFDVPEGWHGKYYLSSVPEGFVLLEAREEDGYNTATYRGQEQKVFRFQEYTSGSVIQTSMEESVSYYFTMNGREISIFKSQTRPFIRAIWANDSRWFTLECDCMDMDEILLILQNVREIL